MAKAVCCDKCGKFELMQNATIYGDGRHWHIFNEINFNDSTTKKWLLCPDCSEPVMELLGTAEVTYG